MNELITIIKAVGIDNSLMPMLLVILYVFILDRYSSNIKANENKQIDAKTNTVKAEYEYKLEELKIVEEGRIKRLELSLEAERTNFQMKTNSLEKTAETYRDMTNEVIKKGRVHMAQFESMQKAWNEHSAQSIEIQRLFAQNSKESNAALMELAKGLSSVTEIMRQRAFCPFDIKERDDNRIVTDNSNGCGQ